MKRLLPLALSLALTLTACGFPAAETPSPAPPETPVLSEAPVPSETSAPTAFSGPAVWTDPSQLTPYEKPVSKYTRRYADFTDTLLPADDYGPLIPFPGAAMTRWEDEWGWFDDYSLYGLMTLGGEVVVDPVFSGAFHPSLLDEQGMNRRELDCLILQKVVTDENGEPTEVAALCAQDGSWCTDFLYRYDWELFMSAQSQDAVLMRKGDSALVFLDPHTGEELRVVDFSKARELAPDSFWGLLYSICYGARYTCFSDETRHYIFDAETGDVRSIEDAAGPVESAYGAFYEGLCPVKTPSGWGYIDSGANWVIDPVYEEAGGFQNGLALIQDREGLSHYITPNGKIAYTFPAGAKSIYRDRELIHYTSADGQTFFLDETLRPLSLPEDLTEYARWNDGSTYEGGGWFSQDITPSATQRDGVVLWNYQTGERVDFLYMQLDRLEGDLALLRRFDGNAYVLADLTTGETRELGSWAWVSFSRDTLTGEPYLTLESQDGQPSQLQSMEGKTLYETFGPIWGVSLYGGRVLQSADDRVTLTAPNGKLLFSWPVQAAMD